MDDGYAQELRSPAGPEGIGAQKLLRLLGAENAPRLRSHPRSEQKYLYSSRLGLSKWVTNGPHARIQALAERSAEYTLDDCDSPDLAAVIEDISQEDDGPRRRRRAGALLSALGRAWDRRLSDDAEVDVAHAHYGWNLRGRIPAYWLAQAGDVAWLDDKSGTVRMPAELRLQTSGTEALYGVDFPSFLHPDLDQSNRRPILAALGVVSEPSRSELVRRLRELRAAPSDDASPCDSVRHESQLIYRALTRSLADGSTDSDLTPSRLRREFARYDLVLTERGWRAPARVLAGPPIFGRFHPFAPVAEECKRLWKELGLQEPSVEDCVEVIKEMTYRRRRAPDEAEEAILLETLRALTARRDRELALKGPELRRLTLWTSRGWMRKRPVYATDDPALAAGLSEHLPIWLPGGGLEQFRPLLGPLRITEIAVGESSVIDAESAWADSRLTFLFRSALEHLREDLQRNEPELSNALTVRWDSLVGYEVKVHRHLSLSVSVEPDQVHRCRVNAHADTCRCVLFIAAEAMLVRVDGGGAAIASLFAGNARKVSQAWGAACELADDGIDAHILRLASERPERERGESDIGAGLTGLQARSARKHGASRSATDSTLGTSQSPGASEDERDPRERSAPVTESRTLVDPATLVPVDRRGRRSGTGAVGDTDRDSRTAARAARALREVRSDYRSPQDRSSPPEYSSLAKESVGMRLTKMLFSTDEAQIHDIRAQLGVGADAVDDLDQYFELKVAARAEPNEVRLTLSEVQRALASPERFFLVVVSNIEGRDARPTVRVILDPLRQLRAIDREGITLTGVRESESLIYDFEPADGAVPERERDGG